MNIKRREFTRLFTKVTRVFPILLIIGGMVLSFASQPLPVIGMSSSDRAADAGFFAQADDLTERAQVDAFWKSGEAAALQAQDGVSLTFLDPVTDTPMCMPDPATLEATLQANLPEGVEALLQVNWYVVAPEDLRTDIEYIEAGLVTDGDTFTWEAQWPGIRPEDTFVEVLFGAALIDPETDEILATATVSIYWYPWVCPVLGQPTETPVTSTPDTLTPTVTETVLTPVPDGVSLTFLDPVTDTPMCMPDPATLEATVRANLPEGVEARLQVNWYVIAPADLRTDIEYIEAGLVTDGDTFTWEAQWPGIRPEDTFVEILFGAALIDPDTDDILATATVDIYWYPWVCPVVGEPTETPMTPTPDTITPTVTETVLTPDPDTATPTPTFTATPVPDTATPTPTFTATPVPDTATPTFTSTPTVTNTPVPPTLTPTVPTVAIPPNTPTPFVVTATPIIIPGPIITATPIVLIPPPIQATPVVIIPPPIQATPQVIIPPPIQATPVVIIPPPIQATPQVIIPPPIQATPVVIIPEPIQATPVVIIPEPIVATPVVVIPEPIQATPIVLAPVVITATPVVVAPPLPVTGQEEPPVDKPVIVPTLEAPAVVEPEEFIPVTGADLTHLYTQPAALEYADWKLAMNLVMSIAGLVSMLAGVIFLFSPNRH
jgi:hypothetical protein